MRYVAQGLELNSGLARRVLWDTPMMTSAAEIEAELALVERVVSLVANAAKNDVISAIEMSLWQVRDLRGTLARLAARRTMDDVELFELKVFAMTAAEIRKTALEVRLDVVEVPDTNSVVALLDPEGSGIPHFAIYDAYSAELQEVRRQLRLEKTPELYAENARLEDEIRVRLSDELAPFASVLDAAQTAVARLDILLAKARQALREGFCRPVVNYELADAMQNFTRSVSTPQPRHAEECYAATANSELPKIAPKTTYTALFNPAVREALRARGSEFQPVDIALTDGPTVITGANMGGKTVLLKSVELAQAMFQWGFYVPAASASIMPVDEILTSIGDAQNELSGLSSFAAEMMRIDQIIRRIREGRRVLVLIDEPARTTNPTEGEAIVNALLDLLARHRTMALVTSHYGGIRADVKRLRVKGFEQAGASETGSENGSENAQQNPLQPPGITGENDPKTGPVTAENIQRFMDYSLVPDDGRPPREALRIARILGVDSELTDRAAEYLS